MESPVKYLLYSLSWLRNENVNQVLRILRETEKKGLLFIKTSCTWITIR